MKANDRARWTDADYQLLRRLAREGARLPLIATRLGRSIDQVDATASRLGIRLLAHKQLSPSWTATPDQARRLLGELVEASGHPMAAFSRMIRRHKGYLSAFVNEGVPRRLSKADRDLLAAYFDIDPADLGDIDR